MLFDRKVIDTHVHIHNATDEKTLEMLEEIRSLGVSGIAIQSIAASPKYSIAENLFALKWKRDYKKMKMYAFGSFHELDEYASIPYEKQAEALLDMGFDGIKFLHMKPDLRKILGKGVCHPDYDRALSLFEERGTPILMHVADPDSFWDINRVSSNAVKRGWYYGDGTHLSYKEHYDEVFKMLDKHPRLNVVLAHFFFLDENYDEAVRVMEKYPSVRFDLTPCPRMYLSFSKDVELWRKFFITYQDRLLFGTDANNEREANERIYQTVYYALRHSEKEFLMPAYYQEDMMKTMLLPDEVIDKILYKNFLKLVGGEPAELNTPLIESAASRLLSDISGRGDEPLEEWIRTNFSV